MLALVLSPHNASCVFVDYRSFDEPRPDCPMLCNRRSEDSEPSAKVAKIRGGSGASDSAPLTATPAGHDDSAVQVRNRAA
jgi:hypothetical protein